MRGDVKFSNYGTETLRVIYENVTFWILTHFSGRGFKPCQRLRLANFPGVGRGLQAAGALLNLPFLASIATGCFTRSKIHVSTSSENIEAGAVLVSIPLPALVTR